MKQLSIYTTEQELKFNFNKVPENLWAPLTDMQSEKVGLVEVFEGVYYTTLVEGYTIFNVCQSKRKVVKEESVEREFNCRMKKLARQEFAFDMDTVLKEVNDDILRMSEITTKDYLAVYDHVGKRFIIDAPRSKAEEVLHLLHNLFQEDENDETPSFEVLQTDPFVVQPLLTSYVTNQKNIPEPMAIEDSIKLGLKCVVGKAPSAANITIKREDAGSKEVINHIANDKVVHMLALDYDGVVYFNIDHTCMITGVSFEGSLKYEQDEGLSEENNFLSEHQQTLPELTNMINLVVSELDK